MRFYEFSETKIQEVIPALAAVAGAAARGLAGAAVKGAARAAKGLGKAAVRGLSSAASKRIAGTSSRASSAGSANTRPSTNQRTTNNPNATVGTQNQIGTDEPQAQPNNIRPSTNSTQQLNLRPGSTVKLPALTPAGKPGPAKPFRVSKADNKEIEITNPFPKPGEPRKYTFKRGDLEQALSDEN